MEFCPDCENMLHPLQVTPDEGVQLKCRRCPYARAIDHENPLLYEHNLKEDSAARIVVNPFLTQCPTLPRFTTIQCPTEGCLSKDVVGVKLDAVNVVWFYQCGVCKHSWKQASRRT